MATTGGKDNFIVSIPSGTTADALTVVAWLPFSSWPRNINRWSGFLLNTGATNTLSYALRGYVAWSIDGTLYQPLASGTLAAGASIPFKISDLYDVVQVLLQSTVGGSSTTYRLEAKGGS